MNKLATLFLTATLSVASGAALAADSNSAGQNNGQANSSAEAGQVAPDAHQNVAPKGVDGNNVNNSGTMLHPDNNSSMSGDNMSKEEIHKNTMCKDGRCPDMNKKVETGSGSDVDTKTDGTTQ
ncbi:YbgS-like family protein [Enterobacteriaceae bacterium H11S18]|uniref:YbgS-like family protein n=1 Tax=Dryocola clanedunensis TaxID=2925396 RepID=UPI0022EFF96F|nr:YbgS-like family protein [Dryocola clanedunensis]MCT4710811.1 YbgS-like family protein [Dryocola clanedunensis]